MITLRPVVATAFAAAAVSLAACSAGVTTAGSTGSSSSTAPSNTAPSNTGSSPAPGSTAPAGPTGAQQSTPAGGGAGVPNLSGLPGAVSSAINGASGAIIGHSAGSASTVPTRATGQLPPGFPLPAGTKIVSVVHTATEIDGRLSVPSTAYSFWRGALPSAGYAVTESQSVGSAGEIRFHGHGCVGDSQIALTGSTAVVQCNLG